MQSSNLKITKNETGSAGIKFLLAAFSLTGILIFWNWFANKSFNDTINAFVQMVQPESQAPNGIALNLPPMPVLDPLPTVVQFQEISLDVAPVSAPVIVEPTAEEPIQASQATGLTSAQPQPVLRVVGAPTPFPVVQKVKPKVEAIEAYVPPSTGGGGGGGSKKKSSGGGGSTSSS